MLSGFLYGVAACLIWGTVYVIPELLSNHSPLWIALLRYAVFGAFCALLLIVRRQDAAKLTRRDWMTASLLGIIGNLFYYWVLSAAVVRIGASLAAVFSALIPLTASVTATVLDRSRRGNLKRLALPIALIAVGLFFLNADRLSFIGTEAAGVSAGEYLFGLALAAFSVVIWTWFPLANAAWIRHHPKAPLSVWTAAQGAAVLPVSVIGFLSLPLLSQGESLIPDLHGIVLILFLALACSWGGNLLWNKMSCRLPSVLVGQMIVFETLSACFYESLYLGTVPSAKALFGAVFVLSGVSLSLLLLSDSLPAPLEKLVGRFFGRPALH